MDNRTFDGRNSSVRGRGRGGNQRGRGAKQPFVGGRTMMRFPQGSLRVNGGPSASMISKEFEETKVHVSNLDIGVVSSDDIKVIFSSAGELKRYALHYNKEGLPSGSAEVVYVKRSDAFAAVKRFNNVKLDGRPLKIEVINPTPAAVPVSVHVNLTGAAAVVITYAPEQPSRSNAPCLIEPMARGNCLIEPMARGNQGALQRGETLNNMRGRGGRGYGGGQKKFLKEAAAAKREVRSGAGHGKALSSQVPLIIKKRN